MKLSNELKRLDDMTNMLHMYLCGLRVPERLVGALEYARDEAEAINARISWAAGKVERGEIPDAEFEFPGENEGGADE